MTRIDTENRSPFPIPFGWFQIGWGGDLKPGEVKPLEYFGRHLAPWYAQFAGALAAAPGADFYAKVGGLLAAFMDIERQAFDMMEAEAH